MPLEKSERFVCIGFEDDSDIAHCTVLIKSWDKKLMGFSSKYPDKVKMIRELVFDDLVEGHEFEVPKRMFLMREPKKKKEMTEEQKVVAANRLKKAREKKVKNQE